MYFYVHVKSVKGLFDSFHEHSCFFLFIILFFSNFNSVGFLFFLFFYFSGIFLRCHHDNGAEKINVYVKNNIGYDDTF